MDRPLHRMLQDPICNLSHSDMHLNHTLDTFIFTLKDTKGLRGVLRGPNAQSQSITKERTEAHHTLAVPRK